ncbi:D-alanine--D-alanine ligase [uncultured Bradyrhizobium sp.]|uniref:D-alanine--D-alanine ligase n=1 Tax=uncultured Bradyrhizobium sp. TaxID=199684 RepID=UPI0035C96375
MQFALIYGGRSVEHDWSVAMYAHFAARINETAKLRPLLTAVIYISPTGELLLMSVDKRGAPSHREVLETQARPMLDALPQIMKQLDVFLFSLLQGQDGEDGQIQSIAQFFDIPGSFGSKNAAMLATDKYIQTKIVEATCSDLSPIPTVWVDPYRVGAFIPAISRAISSGPYVAKPNNLGGSFMTEPFDSLEEFDLHKYALALSDYDDRFVVQERIIGTEFTCGVLFENGKYRPLPVVQINAPSRFLGYKEKTSKGSYTVVFPEAGTALYDRICAASVSIADLFDVHTFCRIDYIVDSHERIYFFELNVTPGLTAGSIFPKMLAKAGLDVLDLIAMAATNESARRLRERNRKQRTGAFRYGTAHAPT